MDLQKLISGYTFCISYAPFKDEINPSLSSFPLTAPHPILLPSSTTADPFEWAAKTREVCGDAQTFILIPGTQFDAYGTRHGRGGGWYDRFLSKAPEDWLRIGVCDSSQFSKEKLERKPWDEPMDWIVSFDTETWRAIPALTPRISPSQK